MNVSDALSMFMWRRTQSVIQPCLCAIVDVDACVDEKQWRPRSDREVGTETAHISAPINDDESDAKQCSVVTQNCTGEWWRTTEHHASQTLSPDTTVVWLCLLSLTVNHR